MWRDLISQSETFCFSGEPSVAIFFRRQVLNNIGFGGKNQEELHRRDPREAKSTLARHLGEHPEVGLHFVCLTVGDYCIDEKLTSSSNDFALGRRTRFRQFIRPIRLT